MNAECYVSAVIKKYYTEDRSLTNIPERRKRELLELVEKTAGKREEWQNGLRKS